MDRIERKTTNLIEWFFAQLRVIYWFNKGCSGGFSKPCLLYTLVTWCLYVGHLHAFILAKSWYLWAHRYIDNPLHLIFNTHEHNLKHLLSYSVHNQFMCEMVSSCSIRRNGKIKACQRNFFGQHVNGDSLVWRQGFMLPLIYVLIYRVGHYCTNEFIYIVSLFLEISIFSALSLGFL